MRHSDIGIRGCEKSTHIWRCYRAPAQARVEYCIEYVKAVVAKLQSVAKRRATNNLFWSLGLWRLLRCCTGFRGKRPPFPFRASRVKGMGGLILLKMSATTQQPYLTLVMTKGLFVAQHNATKRDKCNEDTTFFPAIIVWHFPIRLDSKGVCVWRGMIIEFWVSKWRENGVLVS